MEYTDKKEHRVAVLTDVNDAEEFIVVSDRNIALLGEHDKLVAILAAAMISQPPLRAVVTDAIQRVMNYKDEAGTTQDV